MDSKIFKGAFSFGSSTASAGTAISITVPPLRKCITRLTNLVYRSGATAHTLTVMTPRSSASATAAVAAAGTTIVLDGALLVGASDALAASDWVVVELSDGSFHTSLVSSWSASTYTLVLGTAMPATAGIAQGGKVWAFGVPADLGHKAFSPGATTTEITRAVTTYTDPTSGIVSTGRPKELFAEATYGDRSGRFDPMIIHSNNATNAGVIEAASGYYATF